MAESAAAAMMKLGASGGVREGKVFETGDPVVGDRSVPPQSASVWRDKRVIVDGGSSGESSSSGKSDVVLVPCNSPQDEGASDSGRPDTAHGGGRGWSGRPYAPHGGGRGISSRVSSGVHDCARGAWEWSEKQRVDSSGSSSEYGCEGGKWTTTAILGRDLVWRPSDKGRVMDSGVEDNVVETEEFPAVYVRTLFREKYMREEEGDLCTYGLFDEVVGEVTDSSTKRCSSMWIDE